MSSEIDWNNLTPEQKITPRDELERLEKESVDREKLLQLAKGSFITSFARYSFQTVAWPIGGAAGAAVYGGGAFLGIFAASKIVEAVAGAPWPSVPLIEAANGASDILGQVTPSPFSELLHNATDQILTFGAAIGEMIPNEIKQKGVDAINNIQVSIVSAVSGFSAATVGLRVGSTYFSNKADQFGSKLGTAASLQAFRVQSSLFKISPIKED